MKFKFSVIRIIIPLVVWFSWIVMISCNKNDDSNNDVLTLSGDASGAQEVPAVSTTASATLTGSLNTQTKLLTYSISWAGLSGNVIAAHFHGPAAPGENALPLIAFSITNNGTTGNLSGSETLADTTLQHFINGKIYYNLHTTDHTGGEIRGQVAVN